MIKAIQTEYNGHLFRSRLEARWAVFFDAMRIEYQYEPEGFEVGNGGEVWWRYLPDFYLPKTKTWVEVKGDWSTCDDDYFNMLFWLGEGASPLPHMSESADRLTGGLVLLGSLPIDKPDLPYFMMITNHKGPCVESAYFIDGFQRLGWGSVTPIGGEWIKQRVSIQRYLYGRQDHLTRHCFTKARKARFEFGQTPKAV